MSMQYMSYGSKSTLGRYKSEQFVLLQPCVVKHSSSDLAAVCGRRFGIHSSNDFLPGLAGKCTAEKTPSALLK